MSKKVRAWYYAFNRWVLIGEGCECVWRKKIEWYKSQGYTVREESYQ